MFIQLAKGVGLKSRQKFVVAISIVLSVLAPLSIPLASDASRSQTNTSPSSNASSIAAAAAMTRTQTAADGVSPVAEPPDNSSDRGFSTEDFLNPDDGKRKPKKVPAAFKATISPAAASAMDDPSQINLKIRMTIPQNKDSVDQFVAYPYPMPLPTPKRPPGTKGGVAPTTKPIIPHQAYDKMPATRKSIRDMILQTGYTARTKKSIAYPSGGWRWQMAYRNALKKSHREEPMMINEMYSFIDVMEPLVKEECEKFDDLEEDRQRRYEQAYEDFQVSRTEHEYLAVKKGYYPIEFNFTKGWRGQKSACDLKLGPGTWWLTGTHKVPGLTYYWQYPVQVAAGSVENVELNWQNALVIEGGW